MLLQKNNMMNLIDKYKQIYNKLSGILISICLIVIIMLLTLSSEIQLINVLIFVIESKGKTNL